MNELWPWIRDKILPTLIVALMVAAIQLWIDVRILKVDMERIEIYVDQLWRSK